MDIKIKKHVEIPSLIYDATLTKPGDSATFNVTFFNNDTINGELSSIVHSTPTCVYQTGKACTSNKSQASIDS